jgi:hypothetical protein
LPDSQTPAKQSPPSALEFPVPPVPRRPLLKPDAVPMPLVVLPAVGVAGVAAAIMLPLDRPGLGWLLVGLVVAAAVYVVDSKSRGEAKLPSPAGILWTSAALLLLAVGSIRASGWLFTLCALAACVAGSLAVVGRRSVRGLWFDMFAVPILALRGLPWFIRAGVALRPRDKAKANRVGISILVSVVLLTVFLPLLGSADAAFAGLLRDLVPKLDAVLLLRWLFVFGLVGLGTLGACYLLAAPPLPAGVRERRSRALHRVEWALPMGVLVVLFAAFVAVQIVTLFGGNSYVLRTSALTYAEYARSGFRQLVAITVLTLAVISTALHWASKESRPDRVLLRVLLGALSVLTLVIVASALGRMWTYQQAYGFTVLRVLVETCELWIGALYLLMIAALVRLDQAWLPRAVVGAAAVALLALAALNPDAFIANRNVDRWEQTGKIDLSYLTTLSADTVPVLDRLPAPMRACAMIGRDRYLDDDWRGWNAARSAARQSSAPGVAVNCRY